MTINEITFYVSGASINAELTSNFSVALSTTAAAPASLSTDYAGNRGSDFSTVFAGAVTSTVRDNDIPFVIPLATPFAYDPGRGNLLLEVFISKNTLLRLDGEPSDGAVVPFFWGPHPLVGRVFNEFGSGAPRVGADGLVTTFSAAPAAVPEPTTLAMVGLGLAGAWVRRRSRSRRTS
jgi:hypothetical protein